MKLWSIGAEAFQQQFRFNLCVQTAEEKFPGGKAAGLLRTMFRLACAEGTATGPSNETAEMSVNEISNENQKEPEANRVPKEQINQYLSILMTDSVGFVRKVGTKCHHRLCWGPSLCMSLGHPQPPPHR